MPASTAYSTCVPARRMAHSCSSPTSPALPFVLVMSSSAGAAIGVTEGITVILRQAEQLSDFNDRLVLFAIGIVLFGIPCRRASW